MRVAALSLLLVMSACKQQPSAATPELAYRTFVDALNKGQTRRAWSMLSTSTKEKAQARSKALVEATHGLVRDEPETLLFQGSKPPQLATLLVTPVRSDESSAVLSVDDGAGPHEIKLVRDSGKWFIDFSERL